MKKFKSIDSTKVLIMMLVVMMLGAPVVDTIGNIGSNLVGFLLQDKTGFELKAQTAPKKDEFQIFIDNKPVEFTDDLGYPFIVNNRTMVPIRIISENMGYKVEWDNSTRKVTITDREIKVEFNIGNSYAFVNGVRRPIDIQDGKIVDTKAVIKNNRTMVPLRFISEMFGAKVEYDRVNGQHIIHITTGEEVIPVEPIEPVEPGKIVFDKSKDTLPDGRMNEAKTEEYLDEVIRNINVYTENGKHYFKYDKVDVPEGYQVGIGFSVIPKSGSGIDPINLSVAPFVNLEENTIPRNSGFTKPLRNNAVEKADLMMLTVSIIMPSYDGSAGGIKSTVMYKINYNPMKNTVSNYKQDKWGSGNTVPFDKNLVFEGLKIKR